MAWPEAARNPAHQPGSRECFRLICFVAFFAFGVRRCANYLVDALVIKPDRDTARRKKNSHAVTDHERLRVIHLESLPPWSSTVNTRNGLSLA